MDSVMQQGRDMTEAEWQARCDLAALYRITDLFGWTDTIDTHMTVRIPGEPKCFLINNYGDLFDEITASSLVKMDIDGKVYGKDGRFNAAGFTIHSGVYKARPDANCVMHTHTRAGTGVSVLKKGLRPISQDVLSVWDDLVYHEYGMPTSQEECDSLGVSCQQGNSVVLRNHGLLTVGRTIADAFLSMYTLENTCRIQIDAQAGGAELVSVNPAILAGMADVMRIATAGQGAQLAWPALLRKVERLDPGYKT